ncbi:MAG: EAL domain-containing protein [Lachnospiraceae bacterium]|nr:EAL domain-containing protein [Lachnospiraceae bacterium]
MQYNLVFDYVGLFMLIVMLLYFRPKGQSALASYRVFYIILFSLLLTAGLDILAVVYRMQPEVLPKEAVALINLFNCMVQLFVVVAYTAYLKAITQMESWLTKGWSRMIYLPYIIAFAITSVFAVRNCMIGERGDTFRDHPILKILFAILLFYYLITALIIGLQSQGVLGRKRTTHLMISAVLLEGLQLMQVMYTRIYIVVFFSALVMLHVMLLVQRAEKLFDSADALKKEVLIRSTEEDYQTQRDFFVMFIRFLDYDVLEDAIGQEDAEAFMRQAVIYLNGLRRDDLVFRIEKSCLLLKLPKNEKEERWGTPEEIREAVCKRFGEPWRAGLMQSMMSAAFVTANCPEEIPNIDDFQKVVDRIQKADMEAGEILPVRKLLSENEDAHILEAIRRALKEHTFQVYYQPIYSTKEKKIVAAEALIRLFDPEYGFIPPEAMITMAEKEGYILEIGEIVFTEVCRFYSENQLDRIGIRYIEVNLSAVQCMQTRLAEEFMEIMRRFNLSAEQINFEITETSAMISNAVVSHNISHFELHGISLSLDDYGTGYSNISYLYNLPFMFMKIDKSILWSAESNEKADIILRNIFRMAQRLHLRVVMEGVETEDQIRKLLALKCDYFQGYYFSKPVSGKDFIEYVRNFTLPEICKS